MKKFTIVFSIFLLFSFTMTLSAKSSVAPKILSQGIYNARDSNLLIGTPITVKITSPNTRAMVLVSDANQTIQELIRLTPESSEHVLKPLAYDSIIVILSNGTVTLS